MRVVTVLAVAVVLSWSAAVLAGANPEAKFAVHVLAADYSRSCGKAFPAITDCSDINHSVASCGDIDVFPVFYHLTEFRDVGFGLTWPGEWGELVYQSCSFATLYHYNNVGDPGTFDPGDGVGHSYDGCQQQTAVVPGWGRLAATFPGRICGAPLPGYPGYFIGDCDIQRDDPICTFCAGVCGASGDDCMGPSAAEGETWSAVKELFR
jgi:hypothetical protein